MSTGLTPETRREKFLAKAAGEASTAPTPITREEIYLDAISSGGGGGGGTTNYNDLSNKPSVNNVTLTGNKSISDLGIDAVPAVGSGDNGKVLTAAYSSDTGSYSWTALSVSAANVSGLATVATSGAYSDLTGTPTIPTYGYASQSTAGLVRAWTTTDGTSTTLHIATEAPTP